MTRECDCLTDEQYSYFSSGPPLPRLGAKVSTYLQVAQPRSLGLSSEWLFKHYTNAIAHLRYLMIQIFLQCRLVIIQAYLKFVLWSKSYFKDQPQFQL